ncbi:MAG: FAD:protein FMN transferase [Thermodesulfovibrionales bacterium]
MYTITTITIRAKDRDIAKKTIEDAFLEIKRLEEILNYYDERSEIRKINRNAGIKPVKVSKETFDLIQKAIKVSEITEGGFDITAGPLIKLWDFKTKKIPTGQEIKNALSLVDYRAIVLNKADYTVFIKKKGMEINPGGIIKGYASEKIAGLLVEKGIKGGIVSIGGDIKTFGLKLDNRGWMVGIQSPRPKTNKDEIFGKVELSNKCISTSGDYERYFELDGVRYHHILDLKTGYPARGIMSVTVVTDDGAMCDALATGLFTMGVERAIETMKRYGIEGLIIDENGHTHSTDFFQKGMIKT